MNHRHWTEEDWSDVMFTDESPFKVFYVPNPKNDSVWGSQEDSVPAADQMKFSPSVLVWGGMTARGLTTLHFVPHGARLDSQYYVNNILNKAVKQAFQRVSDEGPVTKRKMFRENTKGIFQQDGARCHTAAATLQWLNSNVPAYIRPQDWPPNSPDLSPIENMWSILSNKVYRDPEPTNIDQLIRRLRSAWNSVTVDTLEALVQSMPTRIAEVIRKKGNILSY